MGFPEMYSNLINKVKRLAATSTPFDERTTQLPVFPEDLTKLSTFIDQLFDDAKKWREKMYVNRHGQKDPQRFWQECTLLEAGDHWQVWGRRIIDAEKDGWKAELVQDEISNQIRVKTAYLTANYHSFEVLPNIANINEIVFQDQQKSRWVANLTETVKRMCTYGSAVAKSVMDYDTDPMGIATEVLCDNASILVSPGAYGIERTMGCWYIIHATVQPVWKVLQDYADDIEKLGVNPRDVQPISAKVSQDIQMTTNYYRQEGNTFRHTTSTDVLEVWADDFTLEDTPFDEREAAVEHQAMQQGQPAPILPEQNHKAHVEAHLAFLAALQQQVQERGDESLIAQADALANIIADHITQHLQYRMDGKRKKYPYGRKIVRAGGIIVQNIPVPFEFDFHRLFHWVNFETVVGQVWGRGLVEILWETNRTLDLMLSRIADLGLASVPKPWIGINNKRFIDETPLNNDPTEPAYYEGMPPIFPQGGRAPIEFTQVFQLLLANAQKAQGIGDVTYGGTPTPGASNDLAETLLRQNSIIVTGEANTNLSEFVISCIETRLLMMKQLYRQPRRYHLNGTYQSVVVSNLLSMQLAIDPSTGEVAIDPQTQQPIPEPIPTLEVKIKPNSNLPNQWEIDLAVAMKLMAVTNEDGLPIIPSQAVLDILAERYPQYGPSGKYHKIVKATQVGLQVMQLQQAKAEQEAARQPDVNSVIKSVRTSNLKAKIKEELPPPETTQEGESSNGQET